MADRCGDHDGYAREAGRGGIVAGIDEAGRGPWAGPVVAAAVAFHPGPLPDALATGIRDSKTLSAARRRELLRGFTAHADIGIGAASVAEIEAHNVLGATLRAMARAFDRLAARPDLALVDGNRAPDLPCRVETLVGGDSRSLPIAAASIAAKVTRDRIMARLAARYPGFGWERNAGYGTAAHRAGLEALGITPHHRRSFAPIRKMLGAARR